MKKETFFLAVLFITLALQSCISENDLSIKEITQDNRLSEINIPNNFNWATSKTVSIDITGLPTIVPTKSTLSISLEDGTNLFSSLHNISENLNLNLFVPCSVNKLLFKFGSKKYVQNIINNKVKLSFIPEITILEDEN